MLKRLYIDNFRCFVNFEWKPERKQLLLGANGSGKSSLLDAIRAIKTFVSGRGNDFENQNAFYSAKTKWLNAQAQVIEIEAEIDGSQYVYRLENNVGHANPPASVSGESLVVNGKPIVEVANGSATLNPDHGRGPSTRFGVSNVASTFGILTAARNEIRLFVEWLSRQLFCIRIDPYLMSGFAKLDGLNHPISDLSDLATWYLHLAGTDVDAVVRLRDSLRETLGGFSSLEFRGLETGIGRMRSLFGSPGGTISLWLEELSDGQRCLIGLYMVLHFLIAKGYTVLLDEPENFISLREIQPWLLAAEDAVQDSKGQLILISHHPEILNQWAHEYGVQFIREQNGQVAPPKPYKTNYDDALQPSEVIARGWEND